MRVPFLLLFFLVSCSQLRYGYRIPAGYEKLDLETTHKLLQSYKEIRSYGLDFQSAERLTTLHIMYGKLSLDDLVEVYEGFIFKPNTDFKSALKQTEDHLVDNLGARWDNRFDSGYVANVVSTYEDFKIRDAMSGKIAEDLTKIKYLTGDDVDVIYARYLEKIDGPEDLTGPDAVRVLREAAEKGSFEEINLRLNKLSKSSEEDVIRRLSLFGKMEKVDVSSAEFLNRLYYSYEINDMKAVHGLWINALNKGLSPPAAIEKAEEHLVKYYQRRSSEAFGHYYQSMESYKKFLRLTDRNPELSYQLNLIKQQVEESEDLLFKKFNIMSEGKSDVYSTLLKIREEVGLSGKNECHRLVSDIII